MHVHMLKCVKWLSSCVSHDGASLSTLNVRGIRLDRCSAPIGLSAPSASDHHHEQQPGLSSPAEYHR